MALTELVETYKFWEVVSMWAEEINADEDIVARVLAKAVVREGLILNSIDPQTLKDKKNPNMELRGEPYIGYSSSKGNGMMVLNKEALAHLTAIVGKAEKPNPALLIHEFFNKENFKRWLEQAEQELPVFWFGSPKK